MAFLSQAWRIRLVLIISRRWLLHKSAAVAPPAVSCLFALFVCSTVLVGFFFELLKKPITYFAILLRGSFFIITCFVITHVRPFPFLYSQQGIRSVMQTRGVMETDFKRPTSLRLYLDQKPLLCRRQIRSEGSQNGAEGQFKSLSIN